MIHQKIIFCVWSVVELKFLFSPTFLLSSYNEKQTKKIFAVPTEFTWHLNHASTICSPLCYFTASLIYLTIFMTTMHCIKRHIFITRLDIRNKFSNFFLLFKIVLTILYMLYFYIHFRISLSISK